MNTLIQSTFHWNPQLISIPSGGTIRFVAKTEGTDPHTISIVHKDQLPTNIGQVFNCRVCNQIFGLLDGNTFYDSDGDGGLSQPLDTWLLQPGQTLKLQVTAPAGTVLYYMCAIHPWMQAAINVT